MTYIRFPLETNPVTLAQEVFDYIQAQAPGWSPSDGNLDVWIIRAVTQLASENRDIASDVQDDIFRFFGASIMGIHPDESVPATANTTWTLIDNAGHTIPVNTAVGIRDDDGQLIPFRTIGAIVVPPGNTATAAGEVILRAIMPGTEANDLGGAGQTVELIDVIDWVQSVILTGASAGGVDEEDDPTYLSRLTVEISRLSKRPILPPDFAAMAMDAHTEVYRAVAIDGYNPAAGGSYNNERYVTIAAVKADGTAVSAAAKTAIDALLESNREVNFVIEEMDPKYTTINVATTVVAASGYTFAEVEAAVESAIASYFSPANWGTATVEGAYMTSGWVESPTVYYNEVITLISNVSGVARVTALTLNGTTANVALTAPASLTQMGTNVCTVT